MGTTATIYRFQVELSDIDRGSYESLDLRVAQHASEDQERLVVRVLARAIAHEDGMEFGRGVSNPADAALWTHGPTGQVETWVDVGLPSAERLHRASKLAPKVIVFTHKPESALLKEWRTRKIHRAEEIRVYRFPPDAIAELARDLPRRVSWYVSIHDQILTVTAGELNVECALETTSLGALCSTADGA